MASSSSNKPGYVNFLEEFEKNHGIKLYSTEKQVERIDSSHHFYRIEGKKFKNGKFFQLPRVKLWLNHSKLAKEFTVHEVIGFPRRVVFDVDCKLDKNGCLEDCSELNGIQLTSDMILDDYINSTKHTFKELFGIDILRQKKK